MGDRCLVSLVICADEDKSCLAECPLGWRGQMEGDWGTLVANAGGASSQPTAQVQVAKNKMFSSHKSDLHRYSHELPRSALPQ